MMQIILDVADRADVPFEDILRYYRKDLRMRNKHAKRTRHAMHKENRNPCMQYPNRNIAQNHPTMDIDSLSVLKVEEGNGWHVHDKECEYGKSDMRDEYVSKRPCRAYYGDSDWIVTLRYNARATPDVEHWAQFGVIDGKWSLWAD